jgi:hypothetical protein
MPVSGAVLRKRLAALGANWLRRAGEALFRKDDALARQRGWQVTVLGRGLARCYHDPRFDVLSACPRCEGSGETGVEPCALCGGSGRVTRIAIREGRLP